MFKTVRTLFLVGLLVLAILALFPVPTSAVTSTLIIRPNAAGTSTKWTAHPAIPNWGCVNETVQNLDTDYVSWTPSPPRLDSYNLQDHTAETGNISNVTVVIYAKLNATGDDQITIQLVIAGTTYGGVTVFPNTTYAQYKSDWPQNPATNLNWTWSDIDALEAGFRCEKVGPTSPEQRVTQLYVEVTYTPFFLPPVASFTYSPEIPIVNETVTFNASDSYDPDGWIVNYTWSFGDGNVTTVTDPVINYIYYAPENYTVTLNVTDNDGLTGSTSQIVRVIKRPVADFTFSPESPLVGETVTFDASLSTANGGSIVNYTWNFDDGNVTTVTGPVITHVYDAPQNYTVTLNVTDSEGLSDTTSKWILVRKGPIASFTISPDPPYYRNDTLTFNASASTPDGGTIDSYFWDFGDDTNGTGMIANHTYTTNGTYTVTLNVTDSEGLWDTTSAPVKVYAPPVASFTVSPAPPWIACENVTFNASASYDPDGTIVGWNWTIKKDTVIIATYSGPVVSHHFTDPGNYTVTLTVTDNDGLNVTATLDVTIWPTEVYDVAVVDVATAKPCQKVEGAVHPMNEAYPTWIVPLEITVTVLNNGTTPANFTVTAYANTNQIGNETVTNLAPNTAWNRTFSWTVSGVAWGLYTIKANATLLDAPDINPGNNEKSVTVKVKYLGDCDGSGGYVDLADLLIFLHSWSKGCQDPGYDHRADFNCNCFVDLADLLIFLDHWSTGP